MPRSRPISFLISFASLLTTASIADAADSPLVGVRRVVFVGDSITYAGQYVEFLETVLRLKDPSLNCEFLDLGLPSETVSGLSEPGHAGGSFPRPDLHERLDRVLARTKPDLVVACYGMNDGIYHPFAEERFQKYREGIEFIRERAAAAGAKVLHLTPPVFDPEPIRNQTLPAGLAEYRQPFDGYDDVLTRYSEWLLSRKADGWDVVDIHGPMKRYLAEQRARDPKFRLASDGVHIDAVGHGIIAGLILQHWGEPPTGENRTIDPRQLIDADPRGKDILSLVQKKQRVLKDSWLTAIGHKRPGMAMGLPLSEANQIASDLDAEIRKRLMAKA